jgi:hypothetical protein
MIFELYECYSDIWVVWGQWPCCVGRGLAVWYHYGICPWGCMCGVSGCGFLHMVSLQLPCTEMRVGIHVNRWFLLSSSNKNRISWQILVKLPSIKVYENPLRSSELVACEQWCGVTDRLSKLIGALWNPSKNQGILTYKVQFVFQRWVWRSWCSLYL